jgi:hypothetical protein
VEDELTFLRVSELNVDKLAKGLSELHLSVSRQKRTPGFWRWCYFANPLGKSNLTVAIRGDRVVGKYGLLYMPLIVHGKPVVAGLMEDISIEPPERSWQCYRRLVEMNVFESQKDDLDFRFGISLPSVINLNERLGVMSLGRVPIYVGFLNVTRVLQGRAVPYPLSLAGWLVQPILGLRTKDVKSSDLNIRLVESFDSSFDELWSAIAKSRTTTVIKNATYLNWRYATCSEMPYRRLAAYRRQRLEGFVILRTMGQRRGSFLLELLARDDNPEIIRALLLQALRELRIERIGHITALFPAGSAAAAVLKDIGFKSWGTRLWSIHMVMAPNPPRDSYPDLNLENWDFSLGDWVVY